jgi:steroid delta-isomerase-like uncharacterized protein
MSTEENKAIVRRFFEEGPSKGDLVAANELLSPNFTLHTPFPSAPGIQGITDIIVTCRAAFEHLNVKVEDLIAEGDKVSARFVANGIHNGNFMNLPPSGRPIKLTGIEIFRIEDGKIAELWAEANLIGLLQQIDAFPAFNQ